MTLFIHTKLMWPHFVHLFRNAKHALSKFSLKKLLQKGEISKILANIKNSFCRVNLKKDFYGIMYKCFHI